MDIQRGTAMARKILDLYVKDTEDKGLVVFNVLNDKNEATEITDFWSMTALLAMTVRLSRVNGGNFKSEIDRVIEAMEYYKGYRSDNHAGENGEGRCFNVYAVPRGKAKNEADVVGERGELSVFDDQIWAAIEMVNAYMMHSDEKYLQIARELTEEIYEVGNDPELNGIYWGQAYMSRHACSNGPFIKLAIMMYEVTGEDKFLEWAKTIYDFCYNTLRDEKDNLYFDLVRTIYEDPEKDVWHGGKAVANGELDEKKYSYNSGTMISGGAYLYAVTGERHYLDEAKATAESCRNYFGSFEIKDGYVVYPGSDGGTTFSWFNLIMFKGYFDLYKVDNSQGFYLDEVKKVLDFDYEMYEMDGFIPTTGVVGWTDGRNSFNNRVLMDHVTNADTMMLIGQYCSQKGF